MKIKKSEHSGMGADCMYKPKMKWFWIMHAFLKQTDHSQRRETQRQTFSYSFCILQCPL
jgi:hypothetical protein